MARHRIIEDLLMAFVVSNQITGRRRAVAQMYKVLSDSLVRELAEDSLELIQALEELKRSREIAIVAALNPHAIPASAQAPDEGKIIRGNVTPPQVFGQKADDK